MITVGSVGARSLAFVGSLLVALAGLSPTASVADNAAPLRVVELFTSHGCYSCPPADKLLGQLIEDDPDLIALEFHVDYWNDLVYRGSNWVDPFSDPAWSARQRDYFAAGLKGRKGVYTPQMVVNGRHAVVGSDVRRVGKALGTSAQPAVAVSIDRVEQSLDITVGPINQTGELVDIYLVRYRKRAMTDITAGENRNLMITNHHIVHSMERLAATKPDKPQTFRVSANAGGEGCAVIVQGARPGPIVGGSVCP